MIGRTVVLFLAIVASQTACRSHEPAARTPGIQQEASVQIPPRSAGQALERFTASQADLMVAIGTYYAQHGEWPATAGELMGFAREQVCPVDLSVFSTLRLERQKNGNVIIQYQLAPPWRGAGAIAMCIPYREDNDGPAVTQSAGRAASQHAP